MEEVEKEESKLINQAFSRLNTTKNKNSNENKNENEIKFFSDRKILKIYSDLLFLLSSMGMANIFGEENIATIDMGNIRYRIAQMEVQLALLGTKI